MDAEALYDILFVNNRNVFLTGMGGTGKTYLINSLIALCKRNNKFIAPTSTTGCSAINIKGGSTLHSATGIGLARESAEVLAHRIMLKPHIINKWRNLDLLIIDECSMLGSTLFDKLEEIARIIKRNGKVFGGLKLLLVGDMLQLPPVTEPYIFTSNAWHELDLFIIKLTESKRFDDDKFYKMLSRIRLGLPNKKDIKRLKRRHRAYKKMKVKDIIPTILYSTKDSVAEYNNKELEKLTTLHHNYTAIDTAFLRNVEDIVDDQHVEEMSSQIRPEDSTLLDDMAPRQIELCIGAQVMLTRNLNIENELVNGSRGVVTSILPDRSVYVKFKNPEDPILISPMNFDRILGKKRYNREQLPLILAWALSIHKSQSATIDSVIVDLGPRVFACGQAYVALSRVRNRKSLFISNFMPECIRADSSAVEFEKSL